LKLSKCKVRRLKSEHAAIGTYKLRQAQRMSPYIRAYIEHERRSGDQLPQGSRSTSFVDATEINCKVDTLRQVEFVGDSVANDYRMIGSAKEPSSCMY
jgi:hypothetical protein